MAELSFALYQSSKNYWQMLVGFLRGGLQGGDQPALAAVLAYFQEAVAHHGHHGRWGC